MPQPIQLFDPVSSTYTYVLIDEVSRDAVIIDPVDEQLARDLAVLKEHGLNLVWSVAEQIAKLSEANELFPGDIIYSGTPENVGPVVRGDVIEMHIDGLPNLSVRIV